MVILFPSSSLLTGTEADTGGPIGAIFLTARWGLTWSVCLLPLIFRFRFFSALLSVPSSGILSGLIIYHDEIPLKCHPRGRT